MLTDTSCSHHAFASADHYTTGILSIVIRRAPRQTTPEHPLDGQQRHAVTVSARNTAHADTGQRRQRLRHAHVIVLAITQTSEVSPAPKGHASTLGGSQVTLRPMSSISESRIVRRCHHTADGGSQRALGECPSVSKRATGHALSPRAGERSFVGREDHERVFCAARHLQHGGVVCAGFAAPLGAVPTDCGAHVHGTRHCAAIVVTEAQLPVLALAPRVHYRALRCAEQHRHLSDPSPLRCGAA